MVDESAARGGEQFTTRVERVVAADPTTVWALIADPGRVGEWAAVNAVGYMGTELPKAGQAVFVRTSRWQTENKARRVVIDAWDAGTGYRCSIERAGKAPLCFEVTIKPEVSGAGIATRIRLSQRMSAPPLLIPLRRSVMQRQLLRRMDRIERAVDR